MEAVYRKNLEALFEVNRELYTRLQTLEGNTRFEVFAGKEPRDVNLLDTLSKTPLYLEPVGENAFRLQELAPLYRHPFLCFFGLGNGFLFGDLLKNPAFAYLIVFEPEIELIYIALHLSDFSEAFKKLRLIIIHPDDMNPHLAMTLTKLPGLGVYLKLYNLQITREFYGRYTGVIERINGLMVDAIIQAVKSHGNDLQDSLIGLEHFLKNAPLMVENPAFRALLKQKNSDLAITVATGPSLTKQLPLLKEIQDFVTIISVDASLPILEKWGIVPDIVTSLERVKETAQFFERTSETFQKRVGCFALSAVQHEQVINAVKGDRCLIMRPFGYMIAFDLQEHGYAGIGMSAANLAYELAFLMGFKRTVLIGQDLAYSADEKTTHASDHVFGEKDPSVAKRMETENRIMLPAWGGQGEIRSNEIWVLFRNFFIQNIAETIGQMQTFNATEGGCHIDGAIDRPFAEVVAEFVDRSKPKTPIRPQAPDPAIVAKEKTQIATVLKSMIAEADRALGDLIPLQETVVNTALQLEKLTQVEQLKNADFKAIGNLIDRIDRFKRRLDEPLFKKYFWESLRGLVVNLELDIAKIAVTIPKDQNEQKKLNLDYLFAHRLWLFSVRGAIEAERAILLKYSN